MRFKINKTILLVSLCSQLSKYTNILSFHDNDFHPLKLGEIIEIHKKVKILQKKKK